MQNAREDKEARCECEYMRRLMQIPQLLIAVVHGCYAVSFWSVLLSSCWPFGIVFLIFFLFIVVASFAVFCPLVELQDAHVTQNPKKGKGRSLPRHLCIIS